LRGIIDAHIHLSERKDDALIPYARKNGLRYNLSELLDLMEGNSISHGYLLSPPLDDGSPLPNEDVLRLCAKSGDVLAPIFTVEPEPQKVEAALVLARKNRGTVAGFKIRLGYVQVYASDPLFTPLYDFAEEQSLPVLYHTGDTARSNGSLVASHPLTLDAVANGRPELKMVACHFGNPWIHDVGELIYKHANVYADVSGLVVGGSKYSDRYVDWLTKSIGQAIHYSDGGNKVLFGTDYPVMTYMAGLKLVEGLDVDSTDRSKIFSGNHRRVFPS